MRLQLTYAHPPANLAPFPPLFISVLAVSTTYFVEQLKLGTLQIIVISAAVLLSGAPLSLAIIAASKRFPIKKLWILLGCLWIVLNTLVPAVLYEPAPATFYLAVVVGGVFYGLGLAWFFSLGWPTLEGMVPSGQEAQYQGLYGFLNSSTSWIEVLIYSAVVHATNNHRLAIATMVPWSVVGTAAMCMIDFRQGRKDAKKESASNLDAMETPDTSIISPEEMEGAAATASTSTTAIGFRDKHGQQYTMLSTFHSQ